MAYANRRRTSRPSTRPAPSNNEVYERVTARIIEAMERGEAAPWQKPWKGGCGRPVSMSSGKHYQGINWLVLVGTAMDAGYVSKWWGTYRQVLELGGQVRKGERGTQVLLFKDRQITEVVDGEPVTKRIPLARAFTVFNAAQADNLPAKFYPAPGEEPEKLAEPEEVIGAYIADGPKLRYVQGDRAYYQRATDTITLPERHQFKSAEAFYSTAFHECGHSSGHESRLNREGIAEFDHFGSGKYAREELVAQITSAMLSAETGIDNEALQPNDVAYLTSWAQVLKDDPRTLVTACSQAQKAADCVLEPYRELQKTAEAEMVDVELELAG
jgi:antirestriction protein ArdC